jgi:hypothetical protein
VPATRDGSDPGEVTRNGQPGRIVPDESSAATPCSASAIQAYAVPSGPMTVPDKPVTGHAGATAAGVRGREGTGDGVGVKVTVGAAVGVAGVGSAEADGLGAEDEGKDDPQDATNPAITATAARWRTALVITGRPGGDRSRAGSANHGIDDATHEQHRPFLDVVQDE